MSSSILLPRFPSHSHSWNHTHLIQSLKSSTPNGPSISLIKAAAASSSSWSRQSTKARPNAIPIPVPARDRVIDFGKYKGKMLGTLPSAYLQWVSNNLRARDFEEWANLADQVLEDPVYKDRLEWELAEKILSGNSLSCSAAASKLTSNPVSDLLEVSQRFGWDNEDKVGWSKINFELLGTSRGGRIPRVGAAPTAAEKQKEETELGTFRGMRGERRQRLRLKKSPSASPSARLNQFNIKSLEKEDDTVGGEDEKGKKTQYNPFPGRQALLRKVLREKTGLLDNHQ